MPAGLTLDDFAQDFYDNDAFPWSTDPVMALKRIQIQRWVASFDQGLQSWIEWRRTGQPEIKAGAAAANGGKIPQRFAYPSDESARNETNYKAAVTLLGGPDDLNTRVWWDVTENN